jgi:hypothetical protein
MIIPLYYAASGIIGAVVGLAELVSRYRDQPRALFLCASSWIYILLNATASLVVLYLAETMQWDFGIKGQKTVMIIRLGVASFAAMALLRTSLFNLKTEGQIVSIGPSAILESLLGAADRGVDRRRAISRSKDASEIMKGFPFEKGQAALCTLVLTLLQNASPQEQQKLRDAVKALQQSREMTDSQKAVNLGLLLMNLVGPAVVRSAVDVIRGETVPGNLELSIPSQKSHHTTETAPSQGSERTKRRSRRGWGSSPTEGGLAEVHETLSDEERNDPSSPP